MTAPRVLIIGADGRGSYQVRGLQMGGAIGARVTQAPTPADWSWATLVVLLKRGVSLWGKAARERCSVPLVWDAVDFWKQPDDNQRAIDDHVTDAHAVADRLGLSAIITATDAMAMALARPRTMRCVYLPHHSRPGLFPVSPRVRASVVAYEGEAKYLGSWRRALEQSCAQLGLAFLVNPPDLRDADVVVAFRGERYDGAVCRQWKSGVKYVNAYVAGRPVLTQPSAAFDEIQPVGDTIASPDQLDVALDVLSGSGVRDRAYRLARERGGDYALATIAARYRRLLQDIVRRAA